MLPATRSAKYEVLRGHTEAMKHRLEDELAAHGLSEEADIGRSTGFTLLLGRATQRAAECIRQVPGVASVSPITDELGIELLGPIGAANPAGWEQRGPDVAG